MRQDCLLSVSACREPLSVLLSHVDQVNITCSSVQ